ncbi:hypothetical protein [Prevotella sp. tf2-5]|nr:hypothetical protein [Prevotella sp. tf2-5]
MELQDPEQLRMRVPRMGLAHRKHRGYLRQESGTAMECVRQ